MTCPLTSDRAQWASQYENTARVVSGRLEELRRQLARTKAGRDRDGLLRRIAALEDEKVHTLSVARALRTEDGRF